MVLTKYMYFYVPCPLKERAWCLDCSNLLPFFQSQKCIVDTLKPICSRESFSLRQITYTGLHSYSVFMPEKGRNRSQKITQLNIYICRLPFLTALKHAVPCQHQVMPHMPPSQNLLLLSNHHHFVDLQHDLFDNVTARIVSGSYYSCHYSLAV